MLVLKLLFFCISFRSFWAINSDIILYNSGQIIRDYVLIDKIDYAGVTGKELQEVNKNNQLTPRKFSAPLSTLTLSNDFKIAKDKLNNSFILEENIFRGGHGEIWRAHRFNRSDDDHEVFILKRMHILPNRTDIYYCALREIYFGKVLRNSTRFSRFITYFVEKDDYWLVFHDEGVSLHSMIYSWVADETSGMMHLKTSPLHTTLRQTEAGEQTVKGILHEIIAGTAQLHSKNILHRDIKPSNVLMRLNGISQNRIILSDFSSSVDDLSLYYKLYSSKEYGAVPSIYEETLQYSPPEVILSLRNNSNSTLFGELIGIPYDYENPLMYDMWSIGVLFLELILGTSSVFEVDERTYAITNRKLRGESDIIIQKALFLEGLTDFCVYHPENTGAPGSKSKSSHFPQANTIWQEGISSNLPCLDDAECANMVPILPADVNELPTAKDTQIESLPSPEMYTDWDRVLSEYLAFSGRGEESDENSMHGAGSKSFSSSRSTCAVDIIEGLSQAILARDPLNIGFSDRWGLDLLSRLLQFHATDRISAADALLHAFFVGPYKSTIDDTLHATASERMTYDEELLGASRFSDDSTKSESKMHVPVPIEMDYHCNDSTLSNSVCAASSLYSKSFDDVLLPAVVGQAQLPTLLQYKRTD